MTADADVYPAALAASVTGSRAQLAEAFLRGQMGRPPILEFEALFPGRSDQEAAKGAFARAAQDQWLADFCWACLDARIVDGQFIDKAAAATRQQGWQSLQSMVDPLRPFIDPLVFSQRLPSAARQVCCIEIDGQAKGTGFLIRPDLVVTAYHVIEPLLSADNQQTKGSAAKLRLRFDYLRSLDGAAVQLATGIACRVADRWLEKVSSCHETEKLKRLPENLEALASHLDFALIRLAESPGVGRNGFPLAPGMDVGKGDHLIIPQHPRGRAQVFDMGTVVAVLGQANRFLHRTNTEDGSSGSPCLNRDFSVVGLHQAGFDGPLPAHANDDDDGADNSASLLRRTNRGIPIAPICALLGTLPATDPAFFPLSVLLDPPGHPVFGRSDLQDWVWRSLKPAPTDGTPAQRVLVVNGPLHSGKTFTIHILRTLLPPAEHVIVRLEAGSIANETALAVAMRLLEPLGGSAGGLPTLQDSHTAEPSWLRNTLVPALFAEIERLRAGRTVWLIIDELDEVTLPDQTDLRPFLSGIYERVATLEWLRLVLLGFTGDLTMQLEPHVTRQDVAPVREDEVLQCLKLCTDGSQFATGEDLVRGLITALIQSCEPHKPGLVKRLASSLQRSGLIRRSGGK